VCSGEDLDPIDQRGITGDRPMVVPVGAHEISEHLCIAGIGLRTGDGVAISIAGRRHRIDREDRVARSDQCRHKEAAIDLDPDDDLLIVVCVRADEFVQLANAGDAVRHSAFAEHRSVEIHHANIVMDLCPVHTNEDHQVLLLDYPTEPEEKRGDLMNQCSRHDTPTAVILLTDPPGHDLTLELKARAARVLTGRWLADQPAMSTS
jgi:hypothetical protein